MSERKHVLVVGAGPVGCVLAIVLARKGHSVGLVERRPDMRRKDVERGRSINLALSDRGFRALALVDAADVVKRDGIAMRGRQIHDRPTTGAPVKESFFLYGRADQAIYSVSRGGLNQRLLDLAEAEKSVKITFDKRCVDVDFHAPSATFVNAHGERTTSRADIVLACDGAGSAVRHAMLPTDRFQYSIDWLAHGYKELTIPAGENGGFLLEKHALHIWPRGEYMLIALPNLDGSFTCTLFLPIDRAEGDDDAAASSALSFADVSRASEARAWFERDFPDALEKMPTFDDDFASNPISPLGIVRCAPWQRNGKVALFGDAAHAIVPFYGQGLNAGFEDVTVFSSILDEENGDFARALPRYAKERKPDGDAIAELALYNFVEMRDRVKDPRFQLQKKIEAKIAQRYPDAWVPLYSMVTFSHRRYRDALAFGRAQEALMQEILALPDVVTRWDDDTYWPTIALKVDAFLAARAS